MQKMYFKAALLLLSPSFLFAQPVRKAVAEGYLNELPRAMWVGDQQYRLAFTENGKNKSVIVDARTGKQWDEVRKPFNPAARRNSGAAKEMDNPLYSPDSTRLAYTKKGDLYVKELASGKEWRVTSDATETIYNGWSSWVYNEEILGRGMKYRSFWWSPDSRKIVFMRFDDSKLPVHMMYDDAGQHGVFNSIRYPKAGDPNPEVRIGIADINQQNTIWADFDPKADQYFGTPIWRPDSKSLWVQWMNRRQDSLRIEAVDLQNGSHKNIYTEYQKTWVSLEQENRIRFLPSRNMFILMSDKSGWMHIYAHDMQGKLLNPVTSGKWAVDEISYIDEKNGFIYFVGRKENSIRTDFYKVSLDGKKFQRLSFGDYTHRVQLSPKGDYFITTYSNWLTPGRITLLDNKGKIIRELGDERGPRYAEFKADKYDHFLVPASDGFQLPVRVSWPGDMDPSKKYPVLVNIYGGPGMKNVNDGYLGSYTGEHEETGLIRVTMDHRGSGHFGKEGMDWLYGKLGTWEIEDYSTVMRWLWKKYPFIDSTRIGITGFSYGGYLSALAVTRGSDVFSYAMAGGSVTDWMLYDTHYTERYMGLPKENAKGYREAAVMNYVDRYKGMMRLTQGTVDDNVHMQNTLQLVNALMKAGKRFELMLYPGAAHGWFFNQDKARHSRKEDQIFIDKYLRLLPQPELLRQ